MADIELHHEEDMDFEGDTENRVQKMKEAARTKKGRGFGEETRIPGGGFDTMEDRADVYKDGEPQRSVEGWIVFITGIVEEAQEDDIREKFEDFGEIKNLKMCIDCRTGFVKGYVLLEYNTFKEADSAIKGLNDTEICGQKIGVDWAFVKDSSSKKSEGYRRNNRMDVRTQNRRARSPVYSRRNGGRDDRRSPRRRGARKSF